MQEGGVVTIDATAVDPDGDELVYTASQPRHGTVTGTGPVFEYTPATEFGGSDELRITISDGRNTLGIPVYLTIAAVNDAPVAQDLAATTNEAQGVAISLTATDIDNTQLAFAIVDGPAHGTLTGSPPAVTYTPGGHYYGPDTFTYRASDGALDSNVATVTITVDNVLTCGDGILEGAEQCDDGNESNTDGCLVNCMASSCGDGFMHAGVEQCDDGNDDNTDGCLATCSVATCGDGFVRAGLEACDDGNSDNTDACLNICVAATCGDGTVHAGVELCDDGNADNTDACLDTCTTATCGDGLVQAGIEQCDDGNADNTDSCLAGCVAASCGDGFTQSGVEQCDDGDASNDNACLTSCALATCGDGFVQAGVEQCDDANSSETDGCRNSCLLASCGDGITYAGVEQCDDGNADNTDDCAQGCLLATCGDGFTHAGVEQCDDANADDQDACVSTCQTAVCGDGATHTGIEQCDDANADNTDACTSSCATAFCGDGLVHAGVEQCDDGNQDATDACKNDCTTPVCGDGAVDTGEECDDGGIADGDGCGHSCKTERCGDGLVQLWLGEECDDANSDLGDGCDAACQTEPFATTAPVLVSGAMACTSAVANAARKIALDGNGNVYAAMQCGTEAFAVVSTDRGNSFSTPFSLASTLTDAVVSQVAVSAGPNGVAYAALMLNTGEVYLSVTEDTGVTWGAPVLVGSATSPGSGLSLQSFNDDIYIGFSASGGVAVARNHTRGAGSFETTLVAMSIAYFDLLYDAVTERLVVAADTPGFHIRASSDDGVTFDAEVNPPGEQYYSDWAFGNGNVFVSGINLGSMGSSSILYVIPSSNLASSTPVSGLPVVTTAQSRSLAADSAGNAFVASQLDGGGVRVDRLAANATVFDTHRTLSATGTSPIVTPLPGNQGAAVVYTEGTSVYVTIQAY